MLLAMINEKDSGLFEKGIDMLVELRRLHCCAVFCGGASVGAGKKGVKILNFVLVPVKWAI
tara:strand:- start:25950 stop:26132 length:183 start_codon:yes stop_codon:yes gene_type:complete